MNFGAKSLLLELFVEQPGTFTKEELMYLKSLEARSYFQSGTTFSQKCIKLSPAPSLWLG